MQWKSSIEKKDTRADISKYFNYPNEGVRSFLLSPLSHFPFRENFLKINSSKIGPNLMKFVIEKKKREKKN